jgi:hypothetical protein
MYREHREYIYTGGEWGRGRRSKEMDRCPLTGLDLPASAIADVYKGNPNSLDEQLFTQDLAKGNPKRTL